MPPVQQTSGKRVSKIHQTHIPHGVGPEFVSRAKRARENLHFLLAIVHANVHTLKHEVAASRPNLRSAEVSPPEHKATTTNRRIRLNRTILP
jgi:hypothetical protein